MSPLTASVNESSAGVLVALVALVALVELAELANTVEVLVVALVFESVEPDAHAANAIRIAQNLMNRRK